MSEIAAHSRTSTPLNATISLANIAPRSALRHRPITIPDEQSPQVPRASRTRKTRKIQSKTVPSHETDIPDEEGIVPTFVAAPETAPPTTRPGKTKKRPHWIFLISLGMAVALLAVLLAQSALTWINTTWDDIQYGYPRTYQIDEFVGHESSKTASHFIVTNLHGRIHIIQLPGGDASLTRIFVGPQLVGPDADLIPATIRFVDTRRDKHPDMHLQAGNLQMVFRNVDETFKPV